VGIFLALMFRVPLYGEIHHTGITLDICAFKTFYNKCYNLFILINL